MLKFFVDQKRRITAEGGFTLIELVVVLVILAILLALAVPRYLGARKRAYKAEIDNILQELKTLSWAYYQEFDTFAPISAVTVIGFTMPLGSHWNVPTPSTPVATAISWTATGALPPLVVGDSCFVNLSGSGASSAGCNF